MWSAVRRFSSQYDIRLQMAEMDIDASSIKRWRNLLQLLVVLICTYWKTKTIIDPKKY